MKRNSQRKSCRRVVPRKLDWQEASDKEFEIRRRKETYYKIFRVVGKNRPRPRKVTVYKFWADSRRSALSVLRAYSADHPGETFYYGTSGDYIRRNGTRGDDFDDMILELTGRRAKAKAATERRRFAAERKRTEQERREVFASFRDRRNADEVSLYEQYKDTIPYWPGTFGDLDYLKLEKLVERYWRLWIEQFRKIGRSLWD